jgi:DNA-nicking Smr family endonuclease
MSRRLPVDDVGLWRRAMRDVAPLRGRAGLGREPDRLRPARSLSGADAGETQAVRIVAAPQRSAPAAPLDRFAGVDRATAERLKRGRTPVEARLDLHGMTQAEAHRALAGFVPRSRAAGRRCVLVITGHGRMSGGILKAAVPLWLAEPELRPHLLGIATARPQDGGAGALYILLRRLP